METTAGTVRSAISVNGLSNASTERLALFACTCGE
jgi:hypothetical protein